MIQAKMNLHDAVSCWGCQMLITSLMLTHEQLRGKKPDGGRSSGVK